MATGPSVRVLRHWETLGLGQARVQGVRTPALAADLIHAAQFDQGGRDLLRTAEPDGTCSYMPAGRRASQSGPGLRAG